MKDLLSISAPVNRTRMLVISYVLIAAIAAVDRWATHYIWLGFLYLFPIIIVGGCLSRTSIVAVALPCAILQEDFSNLPQNEGVKKRGMSARIFRFSANQRGTG